ncbi:MAG: hypothetical protein JSW58_00805, partial [Candidatus Latescibacterota bacterium]
FTSAGQSVNGLNVISISAGDVDADNKPDVFIGKLDGSGGNKLYFNRTKVSTEPSSWGRIKSLFERK